MSSKRIPIGEIRGKLKIVHYIDNNLYECECVNCGNIVITDSKILNPSNIKKRCIQCKKCHTGREMHGQKGTRLYRIWVSMKNRENNHDGQRPNYEGKCMCDDWKISFTKFYDWAISNGYNDNLTIDRIDNNKGYTPDNCRWSTPTQQIRNRSNTLLIEYQGVKKPLIEWCEILNLNYNTTWTRLHKYHWTVEKAFQKGDII